MYDPNSSRKNCSECAALDRNLKAAHAKYIEAFYRVSTEFAALKKLDMERVEAGIREHKLVCLSQTR